MFFTPITLDNSLVSFISVEKYLCIDSFARSNSHNYPVQDVFQSALERRNHAQLASPSPFYTPSELFSDRLAPPMFGGSAVKVGAVPVILVVNVGHIAVNHEKKN